MREGLRYAFSNHDLICVYLVASNIFSVLSKIIFFILSRANVQCFGNVLSSLPFFHAFCQIKSYRNIFWLLLSFGVISYFNTSEFLSQFYLYKCNSVTLSWTMGLWVCYCYSFSLRFNTVWSIWKFRFIRNFIWEKRKMQAWFLCFRRLWITSSQPE